MATARGCGLYPDLRSSWNVIFFEMPTHLPPNPVCDMSYGFVEDHPVIPG